MASALSVMTVEARITATAAVVTYQRARCAVASAEIQGRRASERCLARSLPVAAVGGVLSLDLVGVGAGRLAKPRRFACSSVSRRVLRSRGSDHGMTVSSLMVVTSED